MWIAYTNLLRESFKAAKNPREDVESCAAESEKAEASAGDCSLVSCITYVYIELV